MYVLKSAYKITDAQNKSVKKIVSNYRKHIQKQVLLGITGSGKTFIMANIIYELDLPCLILAPNKTLAAQLYQEFTSFFPENRVGYFISYYDYYQPEAYVPQKNLYISKEVSINPELERLRIDAVRNILESKNTIIVASVSAIYNIGSPDDFFKQKVSYSLYAKIKRDDLIREFINLGYSRTEEFIETGKFRIRGDIIEIFPTSEENPIRFTLDGINIVGIEVFDAITANKLKELESVNIFPISYFYYKKSRIQDSIGKIKTELNDRIEFFLKEDKVEFAERLKEKTLFDIELLEQYGYCSGIENYSMYLSNRKEGDPPYTLLDFFGKNYLMIIDESHISIPQLKGMYLGDRSRKQKLVDFGFRLPSAIENRPLNFEEIQSKLKNVLYVSATPSEYELTDSKHQITELLVRPTGLLDPKIEIKKVESPVEDMIKEIEKEISNRNRVLITTLTKRMSEKLAEHLSFKGIKSTYLHSEIKPIDRIKIIKKLRMGEIDTLIGINLLREGLDLPEVSLVVILDADREGYLRSATSLIQTFGRASRNVKGRVILYIKGMTFSLKKAINESNRRRKYQILYNKENNIVPMSINKKVKDFYDDDFWIKKSEEDIKVEFKDKEDLIREIDKLSKLMKIKANQLDFKRAAFLREKIKYFKNLLVEMY
jgi:excinuclease ABC subunit B